VKKKKKKGARIKFFKTNAKKHPTTGEREDTTMANRRDNRGQPRRIQKVNLELKRTWERPEMGSRKGNRERGETIKQAKQKEVPHGTRNKTESNQQKKL